jgi:pyruvate dehydrogenase E2 component (dihydrolipoamide acetyltransferase)
MVIERDALSLLEKVNLSSRKSPAPMSHIRQVIAKRMLESHLETAPVSYIRDADATNLVDFRNRILTELSTGEIRPTFTDFFIFIVCKALQQHPQINSTFENGSVIQHSFVNLALAVDTDRGLIVPVLQNAELLTILQITKQRKTIVDKAIKGKLTQDDLMGGTFTLTNLGALGIDFFTPIINPPQVAILGIGRLRELPTMKDGILSLRNAIGLSLTCDHRIIDGAPAARFLDTVCQLIETPTKTWV